MSNTVVINSDYWTMTTFSGGKLGRCYEVKIPGGLRKTFTEEEFKAFLASIPDRYGTSLGISTDNPQPQMPLVGPPGPASVSHDHEILSVPGHSLPDVAFKTKEDAQKVLDKLREILVTESAVTAGDFLRLIDWAPTFKDDRWGWFDLANVEIREFPSGDEKEGTLYRLDLPALNVLF
jgi:hypothetical protein